MYEWLIDSQLLESIIYNNIEKERSQCKKETIEKIKKIFICTLCQSEWMPKDGFLKIWIIVARQIEQNCKWFFRCFSRSAVASDHSVLFCNQIIGCCVFERLRITIILFRRLDSDQKLRRYHFMVINSSRFFAIWWWIFSFFSIIKIKFDSRFIWFGLLLFYTKFLFLFTVVHLRIKLITH